MAPAVPTCVVRGQTQRLFSGRGSAKKLSITHLQKRGLEPVDKHLTARMFFTVFMNLAFAVARTHVYLCGKSSSLSSKFGNGR